MRLSGGVLCFALLLGALSAGAQEAPKVEIVPVPWVERAAGDRPAARPVQRAHAPSSAQQRAVPVPWASGGAKPPAGEGNATAGKTHTPLTAALSLGMLALLMPDGADRENGQATPCCKVCTKGKACGDSCIARDKTCHQPRGCACDG
jgi:hypothetical protein